MEIKDLVAEIAFRDDKLAKINLFETRHFFCDLYCLRPGQQQKVHSHGGNDKIYCVVEGEARVTIGSEESTLEKGQLVLATAGEPHGIVNDGDEELVCLVFMAPHPDVERFTG